jgi:hypothetical protein
VDLGLECGAEPDELRSVADDLAELAELRWGDVGLRETPEAQQVDEVLGITLVVLHSAVAPVVAEWVGEVEVRAELFEEVREPVPPVARLEDDLWVLTGFRELSRERFPVVVEMDRLEDGARRVLVDDYRTAPVEVTLGSNEPYSRGS